MAGLLRGEGEKLSSTRASPGDWWYGVLPRPGDSADDGNDARERCGVNDKSEKSSSCDLAGGSDDEGACTGDGGLSNLLRVLLLLLRTGDGDPRLYRP